MSLGPNHPQQLQTNLTQPSNLITNLHHHSQPQQSHLDLDSLMSDPQDDRPPSPSPIVLQPPIASTSRLSEPIPIGPLCSFGPRLAFTYFSNPIPDPNKLNAHAGPDTYWFTIDNLLVYLSFFQDTGPLNCACLYRFCLHLHGLLEDASLSSRRIIMYSSEDPDKRANSALLMALYCMIVLRWTPADALHPISQLQIQPFRDAGYSRADFQLSIQNVLFGVKRAIDLRLLKLDEFDLKEYEQFEMVENGDYNWLSPHFIAFASPVEPQGGRIAKSFRMILDQFEKVGVKLVVRLNKKLYDETHFLERGMAHKEMYFDDGTNPPMEMVREFITMCDRIIEDGGVVAVHCKAGLGRTGTLIGAYLIYKYGFTAEEAIGFMRIMRPGTCVGPQQHFLYENQMTWVRWAARDDLLAEQGVQISPSKTERPITPPPENHSDPAKTPPPVQHSPSRAAVAVPGQPRKTPGAKGRHMVSAPESRPVAVTTPIPGAKTLIEEEERQEAETDCDMQILPAPPPPKLVAPPRSSASHASGPAVTTRTAVPPHSPVKNTAPAPRGLQLPTEAATRARPKPRPASALSDHRPTEGFRRSKAVKDLGTLFEGLAKQQQTEGNRYNLRGSSRTAIPSSDVQPPPPSPTRLPQRIPAKRRGLLGPTHQCAGSLMPTSVTQPTGPPGKAGQPTNFMGQVSGRSVRRRRSSLGVTDVLA